MKRTRLDDNALLSAPQRGCCCGGRCCSRGSRWVGEETYVINVYVHLLSDLPILIAAFSASWLMYILLETWHPKGRARRVAAILGFQVKPPNRTACTATFCRLLGPAWLRWEWRAPHIIAMTSLIGCNTTRKPSWRWQTRATQKDAKIAPIRRVSFHFIEFHFPKFQFTNT